MTNPLITPGNYNFTYNELYKLVALGVNAVVFLIVLAVGVWIFVRYIYPLLKGDVKKNKEVDARKVNSLFQSFVFLVHNFESTELLLGKMPEKFKERVYYKDIKQLMQELMPDENLIYIYQSASDIRRWTKYKKLFGYKVDYEIKTED